MSTLTMNPAALTRSLRHAGHPVASTETVAPGAVRVHASLGAAGREAQIRRLSAELTQRGYEVAVNAGRTAVTITLPVEEVAEVELAEPVELEGNPGVMLIDPRTPLAPEHLADAVREATLLTAEAAARTMTDDEREVLVSLVRDHYLASAADCRQDDHEAFVAEAQAEPETIADEFLMTAVDLKIVVADWQDVPDPDGLVNALGRAAYEFARTVTVEQLEAALYAPTLKVGTRVRHTNGDLGTVVAAVEIAPTAHGDEVFVTVAFDEDETERRHPSTVTPVE